jgi:5-hydroxyisourate hydrolase-like protein (transthyretin family)
MFNKMKIAFVVAGSLVAGVAGVAVAGPHFDRSQVIEKYDTNKDGQLSDQEKTALKADMKAKHEQMKQERLAKLDTNRDGKIDDAERQAAQNARAEERFQKLDTDGNGQLSLSEFKAAHQGKQGRFGMRGHRGGHFGMKRGQQ